VERPRDFVGLFVGLRGEVAELRATAGHLTGEMSEVKQDLLRLDDRFFQLILLQMSTLATALAALVAVVLR